MSYETWLSYPGSETQYVCIPKVTYLLMYLFNKLFWRQSLYNLWFKYPCCKMVMYVMYCNKFNCSVAMQTPWDVRQAVQASFSWQSAICPGVASFSLPCGPPGGCLPMMENGWSLSKHSAALHQLQYCHLEHAFLYW